MLLRPSEKVIEGLKSVIETWINKTNIILTNLLYVICICISVLRWMKTIHDPSQVSSWKEKYYRRVEKVRRINLKKRIRATKWLFYFTPGFELYTTSLLPLFLFYNEAKLLLLFHLCVHWRWKIASKPFFCGSRLIESRLISFKSNIPFDVSFLAFKKESYRKIVLIILRINREEESSRMFLFIIF